MAMALGTGVLALPYAYSISGVVLGTLTLVIAYVGAAISLPIVLMAGRYTNCKTFGELVCLATQRRWTSTALDFAMFVYGSGVLVAGFMFLGDFLLPLLAVFPELQGVTRAHCIIGAALVAWPLSMPSDVAFLRYFSAFSPVAILLVALVTMVQTPTFFALAQ